MATAGSGLLFSTFPQAVIFDQEGVLTDTAEFHYLAWKRLGAELGIEVDKALNEQLKGVSRLQSLELVLAAAPVALVLAAGMKPAVGSASRPRRLLRMPQIIWCQPLNISAQSLS